MSTPPKNNMIVSCLCGRVELEAIGAPISSVVCYCDDCQEGSRQIEALPNASPVQDLDGGSAYIVYRKDRVTCSRGALLLKSLKIREKSATNRVIATCCNSAMLLGFDDGKHWVDVYRSRCKGDLPPLQMRICTKFKPENGDVPSDLPSYSSYPFKFLVMLLAARIAMLFHR
ncbi:hypothetical protein BCF11_4857 [Collimonas sp. PA-H2]|uniref:GFA family protein n=1 Tax=Collimonas sp. PA-H2 TaxID=1881062 RepID=UPI000C0157CD|nr:hypothetical protein [Collimonas sp. PA-H2]PFH12377.1 hypothetical protein BCF11_4857 [Collimonas sp. PA-H2]